MFDDGERRKRKSGVEIGSLVRGRVPSLGMGWVVWYSTHAGVGARQADCTDDDGRIARNECWSTI